MAVMWIDGWMEAHEKDAHERMHTKRMHTENSRRARFKQRTHRPTGGETKSEEERKSQGKRPKHTTQTNARARARKIPLFWLKRGTGGAAIASLFARTESTLCDTHAHLLVAQLASPACLCVCAVTDTNLSIKFFLSCPIGGSQQSWCTRDRMAHVGFRVDQLEEFIWWWQTLIEIWIFWGYKVFPVFYTKLLSPTLFSAQRWNRFKLRLRKKPTKVESTGEKRIKMDEK